MKISGQTNLKASYRDRTTSSTALIAKRLSHEMILSWRDCVQLRIIQRLFPLPENTGQIKEIHNEAEAIKETIINKFKIIWDDISHKILTDQQR